MRRRDGDEAVERRPERARAAGAGRRPGSAPVPAARGHGSRSASMPRDDLLRAAEDVRPRDAAGGTRLYNLWRQGDKARREFAAARRPALGPRVWPYGHGRARWLVAWPPGLTLDTYFDQTTPAHRRWRAEWYAWRALLSDRERRSLAWWSYRGDKLIQLADMTIGRGVAANEARAFDAETAARLPRKLAALLNKEGVPAGFAARVGQVSVWLDAALRRAPRVPDATVLWRGISLDWRSADTLAARRGTFVFSSPQSWSHDPDVAIGFTNSVLLALRVPSGARIADLEDPECIRPEDEDDTYVCPSNASSLGALSSVPGESEVLMPRGTAVRVAAAIAAGNRHNPKPRFDVRTASGDMLAASYDVVGDLALIVLDLVPPADLARERARLPRPSARPRFRALSPERLSYVRPLSAPRRSAPAAPARA